MSSEIVGAGITAAVGFLGIVITLLVNAQLQRRADARKFEFEQRKDDETRKHEQNILRTALLAELRDLRVVIAEEVSHITKRENDTWSNNHTWVPVLEYFTLVRSNMTKLGLLSIAEVESIINANYTYQEHIGYIARTGEMFQPVGAGSSGNISYLLEPDCKRWALHENLQSIDRAAEMAIEEISKHLP